MIRGDFIIKEYYSTGELAKLTGVTKKALRYYHDKELLLPDDYSEVGYKRYSLESVKTLQRILMLKYLNFSLEDITEMIKEKDLVDSFSKQEELLEAQLSHISHLLKAVKEIQQVDDCDNWEHIFKIISLTQQKEAIVDQYKTSDKLKSRINIHSFSTAATSWYEWMFDNYNLKSNMKIIEIGCGTGQLWVDMYKKIPPDIRIILTDNSKQMIETAKNSLMKYSSYFKKNNIQFEFYIKDAASLEVSSRDFDRFIANHMLYHLSEVDREKTIKMSKVLLKEDGLFYASTVGKRHLQELFTLVKNFDDRIDIPRWVTRDFLLENGSNQLSKVYSKVLVKVHDNNLRVTDPQVLIEYIMSWPGNAYEIVKDREKEFIRYVNEIVSIDKPLFISKSTGFFKASK